jgi:hypothetical protein
MFRNIFTKAMALRAGAGARGIARIKASGTGAVQDAACGLGRRPPPDCVRSGLAAVESVPNSFALEGFIEFTADFDRAGIHGLSNLLSVKSKQPQAVSPLRHPVVILDFAFRWLPDEDRTSQK